MSAMCRVGRHEQGPLGEAQGEVVKPLPFTSRGRAADVPALRSLSLEVGVSLLQLLLAEPSASLASAVLLWPACAGRGFLFPFCRFWGQGDGSRRRDPIASAMLMQLSADLPGANVPAEPPRCPLCGCSWLRGHADPALTHQVCPSAECTWVCCWELTPVLGGVS